MKKSIAYLVFAVTLAFASGTAVEAQDCIPLCSPVRTKTQPQTDNSKKTVQPQAEQKVKVADLTKKRPNFLAKKKS